MLRKPTSQQGQFFCFQCPGAVSFLTIQITASLCTNYGFIMYTHYALVYTNFLTIHVQWAIQLTIHSFRNRPSSIGPLFAVIRCGIVGAGSASLVPGCEVHAFCFERIPGLVLNNSVYFWPRTPAAAHLTCTLYHRRSARLRGDSSRRSSHLDSVRGRRVLPP